MEYRNFQGAQPQQRPVETEREERAPSVNRRARNYDLWDKFWRDKNGKVVIYQFPNVILIAWAVLAMASLFVPRGNTQQVLWWISNITLAVWSLLEIFKGVNYFRRALGVVVLLLTIISAFNLA